MYFHLQGRGRTSPVLVELDPVQTQIHPSPSKLYKLEMSENNIKRVCSLDGECVLNYTLQILSGKKETINAHISNWTQVLLPSSWKNITFLSTIIATIFMLHSGFMRGPLVDGIVSRRILESLFLSRTVHFFPGARRKSRDHLEVQRELKVPRNTLPLDNQPLRTDPGPTRHPSRCSAGSDWHGR